MLLQFKSATSAPARMTLSGWRAGTDGQQAINSNSIAGNKKYSQLQQSLVSFKKLSHEIFFDLHFSFLFSIFTGAGF
jgi:hypothetical protein